jgi:hypothetical protein
VANSLFLGFLGIVVVLTAASPAEAVSNDSKEQPSDQEPQAIVHMSNEILNMSTEMAYIFLPACR